jgi:hypothetical protein
VPLPRTASASDRHFASLVSPAARCAPSWRAGQRDCDRAREPAHRPRPATRPGSGDSSINEPQGTAAARSRRQARLHHDGRKRDDVSVDRRGEALDGWCGVPQFRLA